MRKEVMAYVRMHFGNLTMPSEPMVLSDGMWHTILSVNYPFKLDDDGEIYVVSFGGLGELVFDKSFKLVKGTTRAELLKTLDKIMEKLIAMHKSSMVEK